MQASLVRVSIGVHDKMDDTYVCRLLESTKCTTELTCKYLPLVSYYLRVQKCMIGVTCQHFQLIRNHL